VKELQQKTKLLVLSLIFLVFASACSNSNTDSKQEAPLENKEQVELTISAAASLQDALAELQRMYEKKHPNITVAFNLGASGSLQQQISQGAPVDLFFSADEEKFDALVKEDYISKNNQVDLVENKLVLVVPKSAKTSVKTFEDLAKKEVEIISIGTPETVPAGMYAKRVFENLNIWGDVEPKIVYAKDVRQVLSYVETANVHAGVVYKTDALISDKVQIVDTEDNTTITYPLGIITNTKYPKEAKELYEFLQSNQAIEVLQKYGFTSKLGK
jgi:molybdate transport system substrate-binding protein